MVKLRNGRYLLWLLLAQVSLGQTAMVAPVDPRATLTQQELRSDFMGLRKVLEESHPGLYRYSSKAEIDDEFDCGIRPLMEIRRP
jgi:hypothetical protein